MEVYHGTKISGLAGEGYKRTSKEFGLHQCRVGQKEGIQDQVYRLLERSTNKSQKGTQGKFWTIKLNETLDQDSVERNDELWINTAEF